MLPDQGNHFFSKIRVSLTPVAACYATVTDEMQ